MMSRMNKINKQTEPAKPQRKITRDYQKIALVLAIIAALLAAFFMV